MIQDEVVKVPRSMRRQVPMIQDETERGSEAQGGADQFQSLPQEQDGQSRSDQDDHKRKNPNNETCFQNPQSCS